jgi:hypothetical protein
MSGQVQSYAKYIGLDLSAYPELLWIADEGLRCPLPSGWVLVKSSDPMGSHFFRNTETGVTSQDHPMDHHYRALAAKEVALIETSRKRVAQQQETLRSPQASRQSKQKPHVAGKRVRYAIYATVFLVALHFLLTSYLFARFTRGMSTKITERTTTVTTTEQWLKTTTVEVERCSSFAGGSPPKIEHVADENDTDQSSVLPAGGSDAAQVAAAAVLPTVKESSSIPESAAAPPPEEEESVFSFW